MSLRMGSACLPCVVVHGVLRSATRSRFSTTIEGWKLQLRLLAVCRQWRAVGVPLLYRLVIMKDATAVIEEHDEFGNLTGYQLLPYWHHNLDLFIDGGYQRYAKRLSVTLGSSADCLETLQSLQEAVNQEIIDWSRICGFYIHFTGITPRRGADADVDEIEQAVVCAQQFACRLPNVHMIFGRFCKQEKVYTTFVGELYTQYAPQFQTWQVGYLHRNINMQLGRQLTSLDITGSCLKRLGQGAIYAPSLRRLVISQASYVFSWAVFYDDNSSNSHSKTLAFQSLEQLEFEYMDGYPQAESAINSTIPTFPKQLLFLKLQWLEMTGFLLNCPVMFYAQLPPRLWRMRLKCPVRVARALGSTVTLPTAYFVNCEITADRVDGDSNPVTATNALLGAIRAVDSLSVDYLVQEANCWADMEWGNVTSLKITCIMGPIDILLVLSRIPRVQSLEIRGIYFNELALDNLIERFSDQYPGANLLDVGPRALHMHRKAHLENRNAYYLFVQILRRTIPGLRMITIDGTAYGVEPAYNFGSFSRPRG